jgi:hypothetical protein
MNAYNLAPFPESDRQTQEPDGRIRLSDGHFFGFDGRIRAMGDNSSPATVDFCLL